MDQQELKLITTLLAKLGENGSYIAQQYTTISLISGCSGIIFGVALIILSIKLYYYLEDEFVKIGLPLVLLIVGLIMICISVPYVIAPEAYGIKTIINSIKQ